MFWKPATVRCADQLEILHIPPSALFGSGQSDEISILAQVEREIKALSEDELKQVHSYIEFLQMQRK